MTIDTVRYDALVVGTGFSGIAASVMLQSRGMNFVILEKAPASGGTWYHNHYPGLTVDIPAPLYSLSFALNPNWTQWYAHQSQILQYERDVIKGYKLDQHIRYNQHVVRGEWNEKSNEWTVHTSDGNQYVTRYLIWGAGPLHAPLFPDIKGMDDFGGQVFHSAEWRDDVDLTGKRVAVVGTGASALQIVPAIADQVADLQLYQRTAAWVLPLPNWEIPEGWQQRFKDHPWTMRAFRIALYWAHEYLTYGVARRPKALKPLEWWARLHVRKNIADPELRRALTPSYPIGFKRLGKHPRFIKTLNRPNVSVVTDPIQSVTPKGIVTADGTERPVDVIIYATGFHVTDSYKAFDLVGLNGANLVDMWDQNGLEALLGVTVDNMPNLFLLLGPYTGVGSTSILVMSEAQVRYIDKLMDLVEKSGAKAVVPRREAINAFVSWAQQKMKRTVWVTPGDYNKSYYQDEHGRVTTLWPDFTWTYVLKTRRPNRKSFDFIK